MNFNTYFTFDNFKKIFDHSIVKSEDINNTWRQKNKEINEENFHKPLIKFLTDLRASKGLPKIQYGEGHSTRFLNAWNKFVDNKEDEYTASSITDNFYKVVSFGTMTLSSDKNTPEREQKMYNKFVDKFTSGNFVAHEMSEDACQCHECGQRFKLVIKDWAASFQVYAPLNDGNLDYNKLVPPESCLEDKIQEIKVNFPTGEVLVADWFKIDQFTKTVEYNGKDKWDDNTSINFTKGRVFTTKHYAKKHNFVCVSVGNSSPHVFKNNDTLVVGCIDYNNEKDSYITPSGEFKQAAKVCTDFWGVTMIDKQQLIDIVAKKSGDKATGIVEEYIKENSYNLDIIHVTPGDYTLKFHGNYWHFNNAIKDKEIPQDLEKFFTVSKEGLNLENKKTKKKKM